MKPLQKSWTRNISFKYVSTPTPNTHMATHMHEHNNCILFVIYNIYPEPTTSS